MKAIHGGKATHDTIDAQKIAVLRRGGMLPQADVYPAQMRATRDLLRRRTHRMRTRAARLTPVQQTNRQDNWPERGQPLADQAHRPGVAERWADPAVPKRIAVALTLLDHDDRVLNALEGSMLHTATPPDAHTRYPLQTVPGSGTIRSLVRLDELPDIKRCPRGQAVVASCRFVNGAKASAGTRDGPSGTTLGTASLTWACSEAAGLC